MIAVDLRILILTIYLGNYCIEIDNYGSTFSWADNNGFVRYLTDWIEIDI